MKTIAFFNNKGGVGKTTLVYHLAYMLGLKGYKVLTVDLDPQANLTSMLLSDDRLMQIYTAEDERRQTIFKSISPVMEGIGDFSPPYVERITEDLIHISGDLQLSVFEDKLSYNWNQCLGGDGAAFRTTSVFYRVIQDTSAQQKSDFVLIDVGPNFGALNRASLICADYVIVPMAADLFSLQGLKNLGKTLTAWRHDWEERVKKNPLPNINLPSGMMSPLGYVIMQHGIREKRPIKSYQKWVERIPSVFRSDVLGVKVHSAVSVDEDQYCLAQLKHYHSLMPMAMEARKPVFLLKSADGAFGGRQMSVKNAYDDFSGLANRIISSVENA